MSSQTNERTRLLESHDHYESFNHDNDEEEEVTVEFDENDKENPKQWPLFWKYTQVLVVSIIGLNLPMASSIFAPAVSDIAETFEVEEMLVALGQTGFVCMLGIGPLFFAPMSETFGRRPLFLINLALFTLLQIPIALAPNVATFVVCRTLAGLFGSVGVANGGGTISDLFDPNERATVFGFYLLGPLLGPSVGPFVGGLILANLHWRYIFWISFGISVVILVCTYFILYETYSVIILEQRKKELEKTNSGKSYTVKGSTDEAILSKIAKNSTRAVKILFTQPIVLTMSAYQALVFASMYSLYTVYSDIWSNPPYNFNTVQVSLAYLGPSVGFILNAFIVVPFIDPVYRYFMRRNNDDGKPEYRLPLANIGAVFLPISLFWFGWAVEEGLSWPVVLASTLFFGASHVSIFNAVSNYWVDAFLSMAASALAAGAFLRGIIGGVVPLFLPQVVESLGYGWSMSIFGFMSLLLMPAPLLFYYYGPTLREKFAVDD